MCHIYKLALHFLRTKIYLHHLTCYHYGEGPVLLEYRDSPDHGEITSERTVSSFALFFVYGLFLFYIFIILQIFIENR